MFRVAVMLAYFFGLFLLERKGKMLAGLLLVYLVIVAVQFWLLPLLPGSLATVFATVTYFLLVFPCIAGGVYIIATTSVQASSWPLWSVGGAPGFSITLAVTLRFLPALRQDFRHIPGRYGPAPDPRPGEKLACVYVPMLMGAAQTAEELSESATARGIESGKMSSWRPIGFHVQDAARDFAVPGPVRGWDLLQGVLP